MDSSVGRETVATCGNARIFNRKQSLNEMASLLSPSVEWKYKR